MAKQFPIVHGKILRYTICQNFALSTFAGVKNGLLFKVYPGQGWFGKRNIQLKSIHFVNRTAQGSCFHKLKIVQSLFSSTKITQHFQCLKFKKELLRGTYSPHQIHRIIAPHSKTRGDTYSQVPIISTGLINVSTTLTILIARIASWDT